MQQVVIKTISTPAISDIFEHATIEQTVETGASIVTTLTHDRLGYMTLITNALEEGAVVLVSRQSAELLPH